MKHVFNSETKQMDIVQETTEDLAQFDIDKSVHEQMVSEVLHEKMEHEASKHILSVVAALFSKGILSETDLPVGVANKFLELDTKKGQQNGKN